MELRLRIVLVEPPDDSGPVLAYAGADAIQAQDIYAKESANVKNTAVRMFIYPSAHKFVRPSAQVLEVAARKDSAELREKLKRDKLVESAKAELEKAKKKLASAQGSESPGAAATEAGLLENAEKAERKLASLEKPEGDETAEAGEDAKAETTAAAVEAPAPKMARGKKTVS
jgi:hypothetical protein